MKKCINRVVVICACCKNAAEWTPPDAANPYGIWHWQNPCRYCGAEDWASHDPARDIITGRILQEKPVKLIIHRLTYGLITENRKTIYVK